MRKKTNDKSKTPKTPKTPKLPLQYAADVTAAVELMSWAEKLCTPSKHLRSREATLEVKAAMLLRAQALLEQHGNETAFDIKLFKGVVPLAYHERLLGVKVSPPAKKKPVVAPVDDVAVAPLGKKAKQLPLATLPLPLQKKLARIEASQVHTSPAFDMWREIKASQPSAILLGVSDNNSSDYTLHTCMFFPDFASMSGAASKSITKKELLAAMQAVGGGFNIKKYAVTRTNHYKGWSECRVCRCRNGSSTHHHTNVAVPEGARHYRDEHGIPLNLFSTAVSKTLRIWYVAPNHVHVSTNKKKKEK